MNKIEKKEQDKSKNIGHDIKQVVKRIGHEIKENAELAEHETSIEYVNSKFSKIKKAI